MGRVGYSPTNNLVGFFFSIYNSTVEPPHNGHLGDRKKVKVVERFKQESVYGLSAKKVAVVERWPGSMPWAPLDKLRFRHSLKSR